MRSNLSASDGRHESTTGEAMNFAIWMVLGTAVDAAIGAATGQVAIGVGVGAAIGAGLGAAFGVKRR